MALPTLTSNSPVSGSIAWTAFGIQYNGTAYSISAGNTAFKFVWWEYATNTIKGANTLPTLTDNDLLLFLNKNGVGVNAAMADVLDGSLIVPQSILANAIAADQIDTTHLKAGAVTADDIAAGAVTTEKLTVGSVGDNLVSNGSFEEFASGVPLSWQASVEAGTGSSDVVSGVSSSGSYAARLIIPNTTSGARLSQIDSKVIPVTSVAGRSWFVACRAGASVATTKGFFLRVDWLDANKAYLSNSLVANDQPLSTSWSSFEGQVTPPSTARYMRVMVICTLPNVATNAYIDEIAAREVIVSAAIGNGQIVAAHLKADAIDGKTITGATIVGGVVKTAGTNGTVVGRMGPSAIDNGAGGTFPGIGFVVEGSAGTNNPGLFSTDGDNVTLQGGNQGAAGMCYLQMDHNAISTYTFGSTDVVAKGNVNITGGYNGGALSGVVITGNKNVINGNTTVNGVLTSSVPMIILNKGTTQTLATANQFYDVNLDIEVYKNLMTHSNTINPHQVTIQVKGIYTVSYKTAVNSTTGTVSGAISVNGTQVTNSIQRVGNNSGAFEKCSLTQSFTFNAGDVITLQAACGLAGVAADLNNVICIKLDVPL